MYDPLIRIDSRQILFDLQQGNAIAHSLSGCLEPEEIARKVTLGLVEKFDCAFARLWLLERDRNFLKLIASEGLYTSTNGAYAQIPMGAYKVGKIAQNRVPFLSNNLAAESWVGDRQWAIANNIRGFAGYPLVSQNQVIGVLATFSHQAMELEFLEVLQTLCTTVAIALDTALQYQKEKQLWHSNSSQSLCDRLASIFSATQLTLVGTEQPLNLSVSYLFIQVAEILEQIDCSYCRLIYSKNEVELEATVPITSDGLQEKLGSHFEQLFFLAAYLGGILQVQLNNHRSVQVALKIPYYQKRLGQKIQVKCSSPILQFAFTHLCFLAGLVVCNQVEQNIPLLTDDINQIQSMQPVLWIQQQSADSPKGSKPIDLSTTPEQLHQAVAAVISGNWSMDLAIKTPQILSERELEILTLLTQGNRDRDIARQLIISESTVKFHMNNVLAKLKARTRAAAIYQAIVNGSIE